MEEYLCNKGYEYFSHGTDLRHLSAIINTGVLLRSTKSEGGRGKEGESGDAVFAFKESPSIPGIHTAYSIGTEAFRDGKYWSSDILLQAPGGNDDGFKAFPGYHGPRAQFGCLHTHLIFMVKLRFYIRDVQQVYHHGGSVFRAGAMDLPFEVAYDKVINPDSRLSPWKQKDRYAECGSYLDPQQDKVLQDIQRPGGCT